MSFKIYAKDEIIGASELEGGDPPMGVVFGRVMPTATYFKYQSLFQEGDFQRINELGLAVVSSSGVKLFPCEGVGIIDSSIEVGESIIEVEVLGLSESLYTKLFKHHVQAYDANLK